MFHSTRAGRHHDKSRKTPKCDRCRTGRRSGREDIVDECGTLRNRFSRRCKRDGGPLASGAPGVSAPPPAWPDTGNNRQAGSVCDCGCQYCGGVHAVSECSEPRSGYRHKRGRCGRKTIRHGVGERPRGGNHRPVLQRMDKPSSGSFMQVPGYPEQPRLNRHLGTTLKPKTAASTKIPRTRHGAGETEHRATVRVG